MFTVSPASRRGSDVGVVVVRAPEMVQHKRTDIGSFDQAGAQVVVHFSGDPTSDATARQQQRRPNHTGVVTADDNSTANHFARRIMAQSDGVATLASAMNHAQPLPGSAAQQTPLMSVVGADTNDAAHVPDNVSPFGALTLHVQPGGSPHTHRAKSLAAAALDEASRPATVTNIDRLKVACLINALAKLIYERCAQSSPYLTMQAVDDDIFLPSTAFDLAHASANQRFTDYEISAFRKRANRLLGDVYRATLLKLVERFSSTDVPRCDQELLQYLSNLTPALASQKLSNIIHFDYDASHFLPAQHYVFGALHDGRQLDFFGDHGSAANESVGSHRPVWALSTCSVAEACDSDKLRSESVAHKTQFDGIIAHIEARTEQIVHKHRLLNALLDVCDEKREMSPGGREQSANTLLQRATDIVDRICSLAMTATSNRSESEVERRSQAVWHFISRSHVIDRQEEAANGDASAKSVDKAFQCCSRALQQSSVHTRHSLLRQLARCGFLDQPVIFEKLLDDQLLLPSTLKRLYARAKSQRNHRQKDDMCVDCYMVPLLTAKIWTSEQSIDRMLGTTAEQFHVRFVSLLALFMRIPTRTEQSKMEASLLRKQIQTDDAKIEAAVASICSAACTRLGENEQARMLLERLSIHFLLDHSQFWLAEIVTRQLARSLQ